MNRKKFKKQLFAILKEACRDNNTKVDSSILLTFANVLTPLARTIEGDEVYFRSLKGYNAEKKLLDYTENFLTLAKTTRGFSDNDFWIDVLFSSIANITVNHKENKALVVFKNQDRKIKGFIINSYSDIYYCGRCNDYHPLQYHVELVVTRLTVLKEEK